MTNPLIAYFTEVVLSTLEEKKGRPKKRRKGRSREYPEALFVILMVVKALSGKSNNGIWSQGWGTFTPPSFLRVKSHRGGP